MDPPPLPPHPTATATASAVPTITPPAPTVSATSIQLNYPDSVDSSPRFRPDVAATNDDPLPQVPGAKLRLMCSYGGHIIPRPHDKSLCYVGGDTRLVVVDRHSSLSSFCSRLSRSLLNGRPFNLKYQLPNEDLDSLVSITTDEDLENMIEEYDRLTSSSSSSSSSRIRMFVFFNKPETAASMGSLLDDAKSETWFVDALNGTGLPRGVSDTNMDTLLNLDNDNEINYINNNDLEPRQINKQDISMKNGTTVPPAPTTSCHLDVQFSMPDSPIVESHSSFGSSSSSPSTSNLPPIRVRVEDQRSTMEEQFAQMSFATVATPAIPVSVAVSGENSVMSSRVISDDERSDHGGNVVGLRKPPLPLQLQQQQQPLQHNMNTKPGAAVYNNLPSPDSVTSDSSIASANSISKPTMYYQIQDQQLQTAPSNKSTPNPTSPQTNTEIQDPSSYNLSQQQYIHASMHYIPHPGPTPVPISSYYPIYTPPLSHQPPPLHLHQGDQHQYPVYVMPVTNAQPGQYMSINPPMADNANNSTRPTTPPTPATATATANSAGTPPVYPTKGSTTTANGTTTQVANKPDQVTAAAPVQYRTTVTSAALPTMVQIPANQFQQQYFNYTHMQQHPPHPSMAMPPPAVGANPNQNYGNYDHQRQYLNHHHQQVYYTQHQTTAPLQPQYHSMTPDAAAAALADASAESTNQQIRTQQTI